MEIDLYSYFRIEFGASDADIKRAYKSKAKALHPDKNKDNPKAKEEFQKLREYYEIFTDAAKKAQYDQKYKAKIEFAKRNAAMDSERRLLKEKLEAREKKATEEYNARKRMQMQHKMADEIRRNWQAEQEATAYSARKERELLEEERIKAEAQFTCSDAVTVKAKWNFKSELLNSYTQDAIRENLRVFGEITHIVMGKKGTAIIEFPSSSDAEKALKASLDNRIGFSSNPIILTWISGKRVNLDSFAKSKTPEIDEIKVSQIPVSSTPPSSNFNSFEADILKRMGQFS
ncbi:DnaJ (Hsp40), subfamily C, member 17 [Cichlidogyrus casuarinus]|uniref:DnaJ (Hsp40), subfamily C, member 17 n=1 Tax=Cichlidogyrus casuarinus TaxID=1844966 RepID=A0ABD2QCM0_9PLAT